MGKTLPFRGQHGEFISSSIAEIEYLRLGGIDQWVMTRGENRANPPLILLHGGPGLSETSFFRHFNSPLEKRFTVVYWDQRGAGKSFDPGIPTVSMTVEQFLSDLDELVETLRRRLGAAKVTLFGHSWGSALGVLYAARHPDKVAAYVGSGQIGDWPTADKASYAYALAEAKRIGNDEALEQLRAIGPPPHTPDHLWTERTWVSRFEGRLGMRGMWNLGRIALGASESSIFELPGTLRAFHFSLDAMWPEVSQLNLLALAPALQMPVFFFLGRKDHFVPPETSVAYFDALTAPRKRIVWFEESGHEPFMDEAAKFNDAMIELVRPAVL
jgi:pimeloyl-ACP methyl ester carboxylesterase